MSRIGLKAINIPTGVTLTENNHVVTVKGPKGTLEVTVPSNISLVVEGNIAQIKRANDEKETKQNHGTTRANLFNAIVGVTEGFKKELELRGTGFRCNMKGDKVVLHVGYSHEVEISPEPNSKISAPEPTKIVVEGISKQAVGQTAAIIRNVRRPEPYKGKGIRYVDEFVPHKEGKRAATGGAK